MLPEQKEVKNTFLSFPFAMDISVEAFLVCLKVQFHVFLFHKGQLSLLSVSTSFLRSMYKTFFSKVRY